MPEDYHARQENVNVTDATSRFQHCETADDVRDIIDVMVRMRGVVVFSKTWCPFSDELEKTLNGMSVQYQVINLDKTPVESLIQDYLNAKFFHKTVPQIVIDRKHYGGCNDFKALITTGEAFALVRVHTMEEAMKDNVAELEKQIWMEKPPADDNMANTAYFHFPEFVNSHVVRLIGCQSALICVFALALYDSQAMHFVMFGLFVDYLIRMTYGAGASILGMIAMMLVANVEPHFSAGPPKQFAALCGTMFSGGGFLFFTLGQPIIACCIIAILLICATMEAALDFCVGCYCYHLGVKIGGISKSVYKLYTSTREEKRREWKEAFTPLHEGPYGSGTAPGDPELERKYRTDLTYKTKTDEQKQEDFHMIRFMTLPKFNLPLGINAVAFMFYSARYSAKPISRVNFEFWQIFAIFGAAVFLFYTILYALKAWWYPQKVVKEFTNNVISNMAASYCINLVMLAFMLSARNDDDDGVGAGVVSQILWWTGAVGLLTLTIWFTSTWMVIRWTNESIDAGLFMAPLGCLVAVIVAPYLNTRAYYMEDFCQLLYSTGILLYAVLMPITFYKYTVDANSDDRRRNAIGIWLAAPGAVCLASQSMRQFAGTFDGFNDLEMVMFWTTWFVSLFVLRLFFAYWLGRNKFCESFYAFTFGLAMMAVCSIRYVMFSGRFDGDGGIGTERMRVTLIYPPMAIATWACILTTQWTVTAAMRGTVFRPMLPKWGVLSFMRLTHFAFHNWLDLCEKNIKDVEKALQNEEPGVNFLIKRLVADWNIMSLVHGEHARHEDEVIFIESKVAFPDFSKPADEDHVQQEHAIHNINDKINTALAMGNDREFLPILQDIRTFNEDLKRHLLWEEAHMQPVLRKYLCNGLQVDIVRRIWRCTPYEKWNIIIPWVLKYQYKHNQRVMWLKTMCWAMPERCQMIGLLASRGIPDHIWVRIAQDVPECIPRGLPGWRRML